MLQEFARSFYSTLVRQINTLFSQNFTDAKKISSAIIGDWQRIADITDNIFALIHFYYLI